MHLLLLQRSGAPARFENVNGTRQWADGSRERVTRPLPDAVSPENIAGVRLETTVSGGVGGVGGDNWNLNGLTVSVQKDGATRQLFASRGTPLFRFTGDRRVREFLFSATRPRPHLRS